jgi:hypothetical protein
MRTVQPTQERSCKLSGRRFQPSKEINEAMMGRRVMAISKQKAVVATLNCDFRKPPFWSKFRVANGPTLSKRGLWMVQALGLSTPIFLKLIPTRV